MATRTLDEKYDLLVTAIKANQQCKSERQEFSVLRSTPLGKHIEPEIAKNAAISLIDCFHRIQLSPSDIELRRASIECLKRGGNCENEINEYLK